MANLKKKERKGFNIESFIKMKNIFPVKDLKVRCTTGFYRVGKLDDPRFLFNPKFIEK